LYGGQRPQGDLSVGGEQGGRGIGRGEKVQRVPAAVIHAPEVCPLDQSRIDRQSEFRMSSFISILAFTSSRQLPLAGDQANAPVTEGQ
jgi:hypothetical protein